MPASIPTYSLFFTRESGLYHWHCTSPSGHYIRSHSGSLSREEARSAFFSELARITSHFHHTAAFSVRETQRTITQGISAASLKPRLLDQQQRSNVLAATRQQRASARREPRKQPPAPSISTEDL